MSTVSFLMLVAAWCGTPVPMGTLSVDQVNTCRTVVTACVEPLLMHGAVEFDRKVLTCFKNTKVGG